MSELPGCMIGPSEPCDAFMRLQDERDRLRADKAVLLKALLTSGCPRTSDDGLDGINVGDCVSRRKCGCDNAAAIARAMEGK
jgi:hypothetical protein